MKTSSILSKLAGINKIDSNSPQRQAMTEKQIAQCKEAIKRDNLGYNVQPHRFDFHTPYQASIHWSKPVFGKPANAWHNFGEFKCKHTAAAVGSIIALAFFGAEKAKSGTYDAAIVEKSPEFKAWLGNEANAMVLSMANGDTPSVYAGGGQTITYEPVVADNEVNPF